MDLFLLKRLLGELVVPPASLLLLFLLGWLVSRRRPHAGSAIATLAVLLLWALSTPLLADRLAHAAEDFPPLDLAHPPAAQAIVILGGGLRHGAPEYGEDAPKAIALQRLAYGVRLARATRLPIVVSGGVVQHGEPEATVMKRWVEREFGAPVLFAETMSRDTHENARYTAQLLSPLGVRQVLVVTNAMHMARSMAEFRAAGLEPIAAPTGFVTADQVGLFALVPSMESLQRSEMAIHEFVGRAVQRGR
jgi:uncharacterized SAM-binding protein YcdF (DUF218 family)